MKIPSLGKPPRGGKAKIPSLGSLHGGKSENSRLGSLHGGKSENCLAWEAPIGSIVEHDVFDRFYGDKSVKYRALKETIAKTWKHIQRTRDLGDYLGVVV